MVQESRLLLLHNTCISDQVMPDVTRHTSHVTRRTSHVSRHSSAPCAVAAEVAMWPSAIVDVMHSGTSFQHFPMFPNYSCFICHFLKPAWVSSCNTSHSGSSGSCLLQPTCLPPLAAVLSSESAATVRQLKHRAAAYLQVFGGGDGSSSSSMMLALDIVAGFASACQAVEQGL